MRQIWTTTCGCIPGVFIHMLWFKDGVPGGFWADAQFVGMLLGAGLGELGSGGGQAGDGDAEGGAGDVVEEKVPPIASLHPCKPLSHSEIGPQHRDNLIQLLLDISGRGC